MPRGLTVEVVDGGGSVQADEIRPGVGADRALLQPKAEACPQRYNITGILRRMQLRCQRYRDSLPKISRTPASSESKAPTRNHLDQMIAGPKMAWVATPPAEKVIDSVEWPPATPVRSGRASSPSYLRTASMQPAPPTHCATMAVRDMPSPTRRRPGVHGCQGCGGAPSEVLVGGGSLTRSVLFTM
eukprot:COSAG04_NODE_431_length_14522_cov_23.420717_11_plen_186_part_00